MTPADGEARRLRRVQRGFVYQMSGTLSERCMSLDTSGLPDAVRVPLTAQLLEPDLQSAQDCVRKKRAANTRGGLQTRRWEGLSLLWVSSSGTCSMEGFGAGHVGHGRRRVTMVVARRPTV